MEIVGADGPVTVDFSLKPVTGENGAVELLIPEARDITEQRKRQRRFDAVFNNTYQFIGLLDTDGTLLEANETALRFGGIDREDVVGKKLWETYWFQYSTETRERAREDFRRAADGEFVRHELTVQGADGPAMIDFSLKPVTDADGSVDVIIPEGRDITERKQRERELERKNERLEAFASVVSHDLKNPLSVATGSLQLARETDQDDEAELLTEAEDALDRMDRLIDDLLDLAEKGRVVDDTEPVSLRSTVERALESVDGERAAFSVDVEGTVQADPPRVVQLLENLLSNAVRYGDHVELRYEDGTLSVADDGPGIPPEDRERVFEPGYSDTDGGHGFGLAIARDIAEAHGWTLTVTDADLGGARFEIRGVDTTDVEVDQLSTD
jgi:PAS domain S-box-containing protein